MKKNKWYTKWYNILIPLLILLLVAIGFALSAIDSPVSVPEGEEEPFVSISGAKVIFKLDLRTLFGGEAGELSDPEGLISPIHEFTLTDTQVNSFLVVCIIGLLCFWLTRDLKITPESKRQVLAEFLVDKVHGLINSSMSPAFAWFAPFIAALMAISALSSLSSLLGWYPPTGDINTIIGWSLVVFILIMYQKMRPGVGTYLKGLTQPIFIMTPMNILGEIATPLSMTFRHFGNVFSGVVISALLTSAMTMASNLIWNALGVGGWLADFAFFRIGLPAVFSIYFDIFSGCLQAFIFCTLTMMNIYLAYEDSNDTIADQQARKAAKVAKRAAKKAAK